MNPEQWLSLKWNGGSTMSDRWLNQSKIIQVAQFIKNEEDEEVINELEQELKHRKEILAKKRDN